METLDTPQLPALRGVRSCEEELCPEGMLTSGIVLTHRMCGKLLNRSSRSKLKHLSSGSKVRPTLFPALTWGNFSFMIPNFSIHLICVLYNLIYLWLIFYFIYLHYWTLPLDRQHFIFIMHLVSLHIFISLWNTAVWQCCQRCHINKVGLKKLLWC